MRTIPFAFSAILPYTRGGRTPSIKCVRGAGMFADSAFDGLELDAALYLLCVTGLRNPWIWEEYAHRLLVL